MKNKIILIVLLIMVSTFTAACTDDVYMDDDYDDMMEQRYEDDDENEQNDNTDFVNSGDYADLENFIAEQYENMDIAGMAVSVVDGDEIVFFAGHGYMNMKRKQPVTQDTIFLLASITKTITGTAVMQLMEDGLIDLDINVNEYLPYEVVNPEYPNKDITVRMLLCHTSSIIDNWDVLDKTYTYGSDPKISLQEFSERYYDENGKWYDDYNNYMDEKPGSYYEYANAGYALLGNIVENVTGQQFYDYCDDNIFAPLGMENTSLMLEDLDVDNIAVPYQDGKALEHYTFSTYPDGGLRTSSVDFAKFVSMMINGGTYNGNEILKASTVDMMLSEQYKGVAQAQGLTWDLAINEIYDVDSDSVIVGHNGGEHGAETLMFYNPDTAKGALLFVNDELSRRDTASYDEIVEMLVRAVE